MKMRKFRGLGFLIFIAVFALSTVLVMLLWNSVAVYLFGVPEVNFWYSAGLIVLSKLLLGGFGKGMHGFGHHHRHGHGGRCGKGRERKADRFGDRMDMLHEMHERFHSLSEDERREYIRDHFAHGSGRGADKRGRKEEKQNEAGTGGDE